MLPVGGHHHDGAGTEVLGLRRVPPVYQTPLMITLVSSLLCECRGLSVPAGTLRICGFRGAEAAGAVALDGETMLLHQGAAAFTLWTGQAAPLEVMGEALAAARAEGVRSAEGEPAGDAGAPVPEAASPAG